MVLVAAVALGSSTYAWFAANNNVKAENMSVIASSEVEFLEIQNKGTNFTGGTISVDKTEKIKNVTVWSQTKFHKTDRKSLQF